MLIVQAKDREQIGRDELEHRGFPSVDGMPVVNWATMGAVTSRHMFVPPVIEVRLLR